jgi:hypothetical protein
MTMQDVTWLVFVKTFLTRITSVFFFGRHNHQLNIYGMNSVDVFASQNPPENYRSCITRLCTSGTSWQIRATWHLALSCWKTWSKFRCSRKDRTIGSRISFLYFTTFNVPWTILSWVRPSWQIPAHTQNPPENYRSCITRLCTSGTTSHKPLSNDWLVLCVGDAKLSLLQEVVTHVAELRKPPYCMTISVCTFPMSVKIFVYFP